jgi:hypothetical protein
MIAGTSAELDAILAFHEGDQWTGIPLVDVNPNPAPDLARVIMSFTTDLNANREVERLDSAESTIVIIDPNAWQFRVPPQMMPKLKAGTYNYGITLIDVNGDGQLYVQGEMTVLRNPRRR